MLSAHSCDRLPSHLLFTEQQEGDVTVRVSLVALVSILVLSLATWSFFYVQSMPLDSGSTLIVVGIWIVVVTLSRWIWQRLRKRGSE